MRNKFEQKLQNQLKKSGVEFAYESERIPYILKYNYIPDWPVVTKSGKKIYIEAKGHFRPEAKAKMRAVKKLHPELDIRLVFYSFNKKYIAWAVKNQFPWAVGEIPPTWLE